MTLLCVVDFGGCLFKGKTYKVQVEPFPWRMFVSELLEFRLYRRWPAIVCSGGHHELGPWMVQDGTKDEIPEFEPAP